MVREDIFNRVQKILANQLSLETDRVEESSALTDDLGADSLDLAEISMMIEEEFGQQFSTVDISKIKSVKDIIEYLNEQPNAKK
jgi:acyl carrier protein